ncbi:uncharacterized protein ASCRUDRAFT_8347 [Ascoidea rubescens DSM 1968]|uniref:Uncharacterized protein n=1 Tax=Ascoidea rubescens DSM 1968 TaxID=1344418 RepID=A0A1D2VGG2_9ASCO|nr:hypothetical protein ASCRUDRAFT_8347 [Ascoidea rubescens DSM 1968]ODV60748.1 hypothetical protein ASCRUDRAFT_8347 [Ascoidea rubescens DSM 1968]
MRSITSLLPLFNRNVLFISRSFNRVSARPFSSINSYLRNSSSSSSSPIKIDPDSIIDEDKGSLDKKKIKGQNSVKDAVGEKSNNILSKTSENDKNLNNNLDKNESTINPGKKLDVKTDIEKEFSKKNSPKNVSLKIHDERNNDHDNEKNKGISNDKNLKRSKSKTNKKTILKRKLNKPILLQDLMDHGIAFHPDFHKFSYSLCFKENFDRWNKVPVDIIKKIDPLYIPKKDDEIEVHQYKGGRIKSSISFYYNLNKARS